MLCQKCILPETFPGISFNEEGICNYCLREKMTLEQSSEKKAAVRARLDELVSGIKGKAPGYDAIMAYSGGKDSSYTLKLLREHYGIRILSMTFDNHFVSPLAWKNIETVTDALDVDHIRFRPPWSVMEVLFRKTAREDIFPTPTLLRASSICTACIAIVKSLVLKTALEMSIPLVAFGWSPGQAPIQSAIMKNNPAMIRMNQSTLFKVFPEEIKDQVKQYMIPANYYEIYKDTFPHNIHPLAFFEYDEHSIEKALREIGWKPPSDTDTNSTNCLLNAFANQCHIDRHGFHPYVWEIANMVRQGIIDRQEGIEKIYNPQNPDSVQYARERLNL